MKYKLPEIFVATNKFLKIMFSMCPNVKSTYLYLKLLFQTW